MAFKQKNCLQMLNFFTDTENKYIRNAKLLQRYEQSVMCRALLNIRDLTHLTMTEIYREAQHHSVRTFRYGMHMAVILEA
jgi:hypothetical protein